MVAAQVEEQRKEEPKKQLPFNGAPIGTVINTIKANTPAGQEPQYPKGYEPKHPTEKQVAEWLKRPARKQKDHIESHKLQQTEVNSEYNIWYGKYLGDRFEQRGFSKAEGRVCFQTDVGWTQAMKRPDAFMCIHWARGTCAMGKECGWLHRPPTIGDQMRLPKSKDCFGRDRHATHRDDMSGVGNFMQDTKTLYVGRIKPLPHDENYEMVYRHFSEWGDLEECRVIDKKSIAFVRYTHRIYAEFAREAMMENCLDGDEILNVRWAYEDPNPKAIEREKRERLDYGIQRLQEMGVNLEPKEYDYPDDYQMPDAKKQKGAGGDIATEYPDTDRQFQSAYTEAFVPGAAIQKTQEEYEDEYAGAGPLTPAQMAEKKAVEAERAAQAMHAQRLAQEESDRNNAASAFDALLSNLPGGDAGDLEAYEQEHRQELFDQKQANAEAQPLMGAWGYYSSNYSEAEDVHRGSKKPQHPASGYL